MQLQKFLNDNISLGKGAVKIPAAGMIEQYRLRYDQMIKKHLKFKYETWNLMPGNRMIVHVKVPSESLKNFAYDVVIEFNPFSTGNLTGRRVSSFSDCHIKVFSNCPSFVYTYAYVFYHLKDFEIGSESMIIDKFQQKIPKDRLLIKGTEKKLGEEPLTKNPVIRNPYELPLFDKSIYYAIFFILDNLDFNKTVYNRHVITENQFLKTISDFDSLMLKRRSFELKERENKKYEKRAKERPFIEHERTLSKINRPRNTNTLNHAKRIKSNNTTKSPITNKGRSKGVNKIG